MARMNQPRNAKRRADHIVDLVNDACERLVELSTEWFQLNDPDGLADAHRMLCGKEVTLLLTARVEKGVGHVGLNLLRSNTPMPKPYFEVCAPMAEWGPSMPGSLFGDPLALASPGAEKAR